MGKICPKCKTQKDFSEFSRNKKYKDGLSCWCKECFASYYQANKDDMLKKQKDRYQEAMMDPQRREIHRLRNSNSRDKNRLAARSAVALWKKSNRDIASTYERNRRARIAGATGTHSQKDILGMLASSGGKCFYCGAAAGRYHVDHKTPLCRGGANSLDNLAISCKECNLRKGSKTSDEFLAWRLTWAK